LIPGSERSLEKGMATHSSILAWRIPWTEEPGGLQSMGSQKSQASDTIEQLAHRGMVCTEVPVHYNMTLFFLNDEKCAVQKRKLYFSKDYQNNEIWHCMFLVGIGSPPSTPNPLSLSFLFPGLSLHTSLYNFISQLEYSGKLPHF